MLQSADAPPGAIPAATIRSIPAWGPDLQPAKGVMAVVAANLLLAGRTAMIRFASDIEHEQNPGDASFGGWETLLLYSIVSTVLCVRSLRRGAAPRAPSGSVMGWLALRGIAGAFAMACWFFAAQSIPVAHCTLLNSATCFFMVAMAALFLGEALTPRRALLACIGFCGVSLLLWDGLAAASSTGPAHVYALGVAGASSSALSYVAMRKVKHLPTSAPMLSLAGAGVLLALAGLAARGFHPPRSAAAAWLLVLSIIPELASQYLMTTGIKWAPASLVSPGHLTRSLFGAILGFVLFQETVGPWTFAGGALVLSAGLVLPMMESVKSKQSAGGA